MKKLSFKTISKTSKQILLISIACLIFSCTYGEKIKGNGVVKTEERADVKNFDKIQISATLKAEITQGDKESVTVEGDQNILSYIITELKSDNTLSIHWKNNISIKSFKKAVVHITLKSLKEIDASSASSVISTNTFKVENLDINASSAANIDISIEAKKLKINASSAANVELKGSTENLNAEASSAAKIRATKLISQNVIAETSSVGKISVYAVKSIEANSSSCGNISYQGNPNEKNVSCSSCGTIDKK